MASEQPKPTAGEPTDAVRDHLAKVFGAIDRGYHASLLYTSDHPAVQQMVRECADALAEAMQCQAGVLGVAVTGDQILYIDRALVGDGDLSRLTAWLHALDIAGIEFCKRVNAEGFGELIRSMLAAKKAGDKGQKFAQRITQATDGRVRVHALSYDKLKLAQGAKGPPTDDADNGVTWSDLVNALMGDTCGASLADTAGGDSGGDSGGNGDTGGGQMTGGQLAAHVNQALSGTGDEGLANIRNRVQAMAGSARQSGGMQHTQTLDRLREFVGGLQPDLRSALLSVDADDPESSLGLLADLADDLPIEQVLGALRNVDRPTNQVSPDAVRLFKKLSRVSGSDPNLRDRVRTAASHWQSAPAQAASESGAALTDSLEALFSVEGQDEFSPEDYQSRLDGIAAGVDRASVGKDYASIMDGGDPRLHAVEIAVAVATGAGDNRDPGPELFEYLTGAIDYLIEGGRVDLLLSGARSAQTYLGVPGEEVTRDAARTLLKALETPERIERIVRSPKKVCEKRAKREKGVALAACQPVVLTDADRTGGPAASGTLASHTPSQASEHAVGIVRLCGSTGLRIAIDLLCDEPPGQASNTLRQIVRLSSPDQLRRVMENTNGQTGGVQAVVAVIRVVGAERGVPLLEPLLGHAQAEVRRAAYMAMGQACDDWPVRLMRTALGEPDPSVQHIVIDQLAQRHDPESLQLMGAFLEGTLSGRLPTPELFIRVVGLLADRDDKGIERLCAALRFLGRRPNPHNVILATRLVEVLDGYRDHTEVRRALGRWRVSPAHLLSIVLLGRSRGAKPKAQSEKRGAPS